VTIIRKRHAFEGQALAVISSIKRRGVLLVLVILLRFGISAAFCFEIRSIPNVIGGCRPTIGPCISSALNRACRE
jgi:hypothetical protein